MHPVPKRKPAISSECNLHSPRLKHLPIIIKLSSSRNSGPSKRQPSIRWNPSRSSNPPRPLTSTPSPPHILLFLTPTNTKLLIQQSRLPTSLSFYPLLRIKVYLRRPTHPHMFPLAKISLPSINKILPPKPTLLIFRSRVSHSFSI